MLREKNSRGIVVDRDDTQYSRKASADQSSPKVKALQGCIRENSQGLRANSREEYQDMFKRIVKNCKEEVSI